MGSNLQVMARDLEKRSTRRPFSMWVLIVVYLGFSLSGWIRMVTSILDWYWLTFAGVAPGPIYLAVTGGVWGLVGLTALVWLWLRYPGFRMAGTAAAVFFTLTYWIDRLLVMDSADRLQNAVFAPAVTVLGLVYVFVTLRPWLELADFHDRVKGKP